MYVVSVFECVCACARDQWGQMSAELIFSLTCVTKNNINIVRKTCYNYLGYIWATPERLLFTATPDIN